MKGQVIEVRYVSGDEHYGWRERILGWIVSLIVTAVLMYLLKVGHQWPFE